MKKFYPKTQNEFTKLMRERFAVFTQDPISSVVTGHLLAEILMEKLLIDKLKLTESIFNNHKYDFEVKHTLLESSNVIDDKELIEALKRLNTIRNQIAHNLNASLEEIDISLIAKLYESHPQMQNEIEPFKNDKKRVFKAGVSFLIGRLASYVY